jgi:RNA polymerase sigma factor (sigma-70 family)
MQTLDDDILLNKLQTENGISFEMLYQLYYPAIASYIKQNQGSKEDAEDIFQEAVVVLLQKVRLPGFVLTSSLKTYLYAIARNLWLKKLRADKVFLLTDEFQIENEYSVTQAYEIEPEISRSEQVQNWVKKITQNCQDILKALFFQKIPMDIVMVKMGWKNKHTAANQQYKCIQQVKKVKQKEEES